MLVHNILPTTLQSPYLHHYNTILIILLLLVVPLYTKLGGAKKSAESNLKAKNWVT